MLRAGWIALGISAVLLFVLVAGSALKLIHFGPCGPDLIGYLLLFGVAISLTAGVGMVLMGVIVRGIRKLRMRIAGMRRCKRRHRRVQHGAGFSLRFMRVTYRVTLL